MKARGLFVTQYVPFRKDSGARIYSAQLIRQFAAACDELDVVCATNERDQLADGTPDNITLHTFRPRTIGFVSRAVALAPASTLYFDCSGARSALGDALAKSPDFFVIDHIGSSWALRHIPAGLPGIYCAHNDEYRTRKSIARATRLPASMLHGLDGVRVHFRERRLSRRTGLLTTISRRDGETQTHRHRFGDSLYLPPFWPQRHPEPCDPATHPRSVVLLGSLEWAAKKHNLKVFLATNAAALGARGVGIVVAGRAEAGFVEKMRARWPEVTFLGAVKRETDALKLGRIGVLYGAAGGGFRLTSLSYALYGLPIASPPVLVEDLGLPEGGFIDTGASETFADAISGVIDDGAALRRIGAAGRRAVLGFCAAAEARTLDDAIAALVHASGRRDG